MKIYRAPAKLNLFLKVLKKREDGFHELLMLMEEIPLYDFLYVEKRDYGIFLDCDIIEGDNIVSRAARLYLDYFKIEGGFYCRLEKHIPLGAGLGGGSSDAATALLALRDIYKKGSDKELYKLALKLGSDVPFFLKGGRCLVRGRGEVLEKLDSPGLGWVLLVKPQESLATAQVYGELKKDEIGTLEGRDYIESFLEGQELDINQCVNDLEAPAFRLLKELETIKKALGPGALMSGSGSTVFKICSSYEEAQLLAASLPENLWKKILKD